ncbi:hypothetical protein LC593_25800 [Nostoc sp. CHAB 5844]|nr:hypothetical protein [Nostoc sp. CHAB 5844]
MERLSGARRQRLLVLLSLVLVVGLFIISPAWAMESRGGEQVIVAKNEVIDNVILLGLSALWIWRQTRSMRISDRLLVVR